MGKGPPVAQHRGRNPQFGRDLHGWSATALQQGNGLSLELGGEVSPGLRHQTPSRSRRSVSEVSVKAREDQQWPHRSSRSRVAPPLVADAPLARRLVACACRYASSRRTGPTGRGFQDLPSRIKKGCQRVGAGAHAAAKPRSGTSLFIRQLRSAPPSCDSGGAGEALARQDPFRRSCTPSKAQAIAIKTGTLRMPSPDAGWRVD